MPEPRISIIMPVLNGERFIGDTVATVQAQTYGEWELLVVDGGSSDQTEAVAARISTADSRIRFISRPGTGIWEAMYQGALEARGEFVAILCASDGYVNPEWLGEVARAANAHPDVSLFWGIPFIMDEKGVLTGPNPNYAMFLSHKPRFWRLRVVMHYVRVFGQYASPFKWGALARKISGKKTGNVLHQVFDTPLPQKDAWLPYWLTTALLFPDGNMCVKKEVFQECAFADKGENKLKGFIAQNRAFFDFYYNFSSRGYFPFCIPIPANFGRIHAGQVTQAIESRNGEENRLLNREYFGRVADLARARGKE